MTDPQRRKRRRVLKPGARNIARNDAGRTISPAHRAGEGGPTDRAARANDDAPVATFDAGRVRASYEVRARVSDRELALLVLRHARGGERQSTGRTQGTVVRLVTTDTPNGPETTVTLGP